MPRVVGRQPVRVEVGRQRRRGEVLDDAVLHDLHRGRREAPHGPPRPGVDESFDLLEPAMTVPPQCPDHTSGEVSAGRSRDVRVEGPVTAVVLGDVRVLPRRDAERVEVALRDAEPGREVVVGVDGRDGGDEAHRPLVQRAGWLAIGVAFDAPVPRVRRVVRDTRQLKRARVDPRAVAVSVRQEHRTVGHDGVERLLRRRPAREHVHVPTAAQDPRRVRVGRRVLRDHPLVRVEDVELGQVAAEHLEAATGRMDMCVLEARQQHATSQIDDLGVRIHPGPDVSVGADGDDRAGLHGDRRRPAAGRIHRVDGAVDEHQICRTVRVTHVVDPPPVRSRRSIPVRRAPRARGGRRSNSRASRPASSARAVAQGLPRIRCRG